MSKKSRFHDMIGFKDELTIVKETTEEELQEEFEEEIQEEFDLQEEFELETGKHAIWRGKVTLQYKKWLQTR